MTNPSASWRTAVLVHPAADGPGAPTWRSVEPGRPVVVGREGDLVLGVDPPDAGISRRAVVVQADADGWHVEVPNANGAVVHPWGLAPYPAFPEQVVPWHRVGVRVRGRDEGHVRWLLLESDDEALLPGARSDDALGSVTDVSRAPRALSPRQLAALRTVFGPQLAWPPRLGAPLQIKQAARRLDVTDSAVQNLLSDARDRAVALGLAGSVGLTQPDYLHVLVSAGYVQP